jgi:DNA polymerase, archaea type
MTDKTRALIVEQEGRLHLDEDQIDIYDYATAHIDDWQPATELPSFETVSTVYLDIETYSNNRMVLGAFRRALEYGVLHPKNDAPCGRFLIDHMTDMVEESSHIAARLESGSTAESEDEYIIASICDFIDEHLEEYAALDFDIDPRGALQSDRSVIVLIGLMNEAGKPYIIDAHNLGERAAISELFRILDKKKPTFLGHFNGFGFDLPFIVGRCSALRMKHPFWIPPYLTTHRTAQMFNKPTEYQAYWLNHGDTAIVDLFHQSLAWDFVNRKLTRYTLKEVCLQLKLRDERRLELSYAEMKACVETGDLTRLKEYLVYDLEDSKLIGDFLLPDIYYQKQILPHWGYQKISTGGMGTKWNDLLMTEYGKLDTNFTAPIPDEPKKFTGGLVGGSAGLYRNVSKIDVASLYPSIMLLYQVCSCKDTAKLLLRVLKYMRTDRLRLKAIAGKNKGTKIGKDADQRQGSKKVFINSGYGVLGVPTKEFNDYKAAAMVTGYGRAILKKMIEACESSGCVPASYDTDGLYFSTSDTTFAKNLEAYKTIQDAMPDGIFLEYEVEALIFYVPPASTTDDDGNMIGMKKNYIIITQDRKTGEIKIKANGKFRKRDKSKLETGFTPGLVRAYLDGKHVEYYHEARKQLMLKTYPVEMLSITRKIKSTERLLVDLGIGRHNDVVTIWKASDKKLYGKKGQELKKVEAVWVNNPVNIDWGYYISMVDDMFAEFQSAPKFG